jgi:hypothetical protein
MKSPVSLKQVGAMVGAIAVVLFVSAYFHELKELVKIPDTNKEK